ncbi:MAG: hypothetical protein K2X86_10000 [Cytophagaceae bacterium]|nr:hypothetical protein [Cytophagaceae bacterium]
MVRKFLLVTGFILLIQSSYAQKKWSVGTYFIPSYMFFAFAPQDVNINLLSGISAGRGISFRTSINASILYFKSNQTYIPNCSFCQIIQEKHRNKFIEFSLGARIDILPLKTWKIKPHAIIGLIGNFNFDSHTEYTDSLMQVINTHDKNLQYHYIYGYAGVSLEYSLSERMNLVIDPMARFPAGLGDWIGVPIISYTALVGIGIGVNIKL